MSREDKYCHPTCKRRWPCRVDACPYRAAASSLPPASGTQLASSAAPELPPCGCHCQQTIPDGNAAAGPWGCVLALGAFQTSCFASKKPPEQSDDPMENETTSLSDKEEEARVQHMRCYSCSCFTESYSYRLMAKAWASPQQQPPSLRRKTDTAGGAQACRAPPTPAGFFSFFKIETYKPGKRIIGQALLCLMTISSGLGLGLTCLLIFVPFQ